MRYNEYRAMVIYEGGYCPTQKFVFPSELPLDAVEKAIKSQTGAQEVASLTQIRAWSENETYSSSGHQVRGGSSSTHAGEGGAVWLAGIMVFLLLWGAVGQMEEAPSPEPQSQSSLNSLIHS